MLSADLSSLGDPNPVSSSPDVKSQKVYFDQTALSLSEGAATIVSVQLTEKLTEDLAVDLTVSGDIAAISSYPTSVTIPAGSLSKPVTIQIADDFIYSGQKSVSIKMTPTNPDVMAQPDTLTLTIADNDLPTITLTQTAVTEIEDTKTITLMAMINAISPNSVTVPIVASGTATSSTDYILSSTMLTIPAGQTSGNVTIQIIEDTSYESDETATFTLGTPTNAALGATTAFTLTITNDDLGAFTISGVTGASDATADAFLVGGLVPTLSWTASAGATSYSVKVFASNGTTEVCSAQSTTANFLALTGCTLTTGQTYNASVEAVLSSIYFPASNNFFSFYVNTNPVANGDGPVRIMKGTANVTLNVVTASDSSTRGTVADSDADAGDTITITATSQGSVGGTVTFNSTTVTYAPSSSIFTGVDTFTYTITDSRGATATATVTIHVMDAFTWTGKISSAWATSGNWCGSSISNNQCVGGAAPSLSNNSAHVGVFDGTCSSGTHTCNANISTAVSIYGVKIASTHTGNLNIISSGTLSISDTFNQGGGTFDGGNTALSFYKFILSGGSFKSTSNTLTVANAFTVSNSPTFNANGGTLNIEYTDNYNTATFATGNIQFYNVTIRRGYASPLSLTGTMKIANKLTCNDVAVTAGVYGGAIELQGNLEGQNGGCHGDTVINLVGSSNQTVTSVSSAQFPSITINSSATVSFVGTITIRSNFIYTSGTVDIGTSNVKFINPNGYTTSSLQPGNIRFNNVEISRGFSSPLVITNTLYVDGDLICSGTGSGGNAFYGGTVEIKGNITFANSGCHGTSTVFKLVGVNQSVTGSSSGAYLDSLEIASSGTVTLTDTIMINRNFTYTSGTVNASASHIHFAGTGNYSPTTFTPGPVLFNDLTLSHGFASPVVMSGTVYVTGTLYCSGDQGGGFVDGTINLSGNLVATSLGCHNGSNMNLIFSGNGNNTVTVDAGAYLPSGQVTVNKGSGKLTLASNLSTSSHLTIQSGTLNLGGFTLTVPAVLTINSGATLTVNGGAFTPNSGSNFVNNGTLN